MDGSTLSFSARTWLDMIFEAKAARTGGVVRRKIAWVEREIGRDAFIAEVRARRFHLIEAGHQFIVICNQGPVRLLF